MEKLNKSQMLKLLVIASLLIITPLLSTSHRSKYLYFILNILILLLGAEAGFLSFLLHPPQKSNKLFFPDFSANEKTDATTPTVNQFYREICLQESICSEEKPSTPSIFFIGGGEEEEEEEEERKEVVEEELFHKAETFIGNFYKQLKMQREESWKKLHDLYNHKAF